MVYQDYERSVEIRDSYQVLPFQKLWTWLTGMALRDEELIERGSSTKMIMVSIAWAIIGIVLTTVSFEISNPYYSIISYVLGVVFSVSGARYVVATIIHQGVHHTLFKSNKANKFICEVLSTVFVVQPYNSYREFHVKEHHGAEFSTLEDKDLAAIYKLGFLPGKSVKSLYLNLLKVCFSPKFHVDFLIGRLKCNLVQAKGFRRIFFIAWMVVLSYLSVVNGWEWFLGAVIIPFVVVYQICSLLHLITEHIWLIRKDGQSVKDSHVENSLGRFCGEKCPQSFHLSNWFVWLKWSLKQLFYHLPYRMMVVQGSLTCHDWHHRNGGKKDWYNCAVYRRRNAIKLNENGRYDYTDVWGFKNALDYVFKNIEKEHLEIEIDDASYRLN